MTYLRSLAYTLVTNVTALIAAIAVVSLSLSGCSTAPKVLPQVAIDQTREVSFDKRLIEDCTPLPVLASSRETDVHTWAQSVLRIHAECATFKAQENREIKKALNIK